MHTIEIRENTNSAVQALKDAVQANQNENIIFDFSDALTNKDLHQLGKTGIEKISKIKVCPLKLYYLTKLKVFLNLTLPLLCKTTTTQKKIHDRILSNAISINKNNPKAKEHQIVRRLINTLCTRSALLNNLFKNNNAIAKEAVIKIDTNKRNDFYYLQLLVKINTENTNGKPNIFIIDTDGLFQKNAAFAALLSNTTNPNTAVTSPIKYITCTPQANSIITPRFFKNLKKTQL